MSLDGIDEWDENFLDEAIRVELEAISSRNLPSSDTLRNPTAPLRPNPQPFSSFGFDGVGEGVGLCFSPPRELSQRFVEKPQPSILAGDCEIVEHWGLRNGACDGGHSGGIKKDREAKEVEKLKRELGRLSKQLSHMEHECAELRKDRTKKDEQLKSAFSQIETKDAEINRLSKSNIKAIPQADQRKNTRSSVKVNKSVEPRGETIQGDGTSLVSELKRRVVIDAGLTTSTGFPLQENSFHENTAQMKFSKEIGVQTDAVQHCGHTALKDEKIGAHGVSSKLCAIWGTGDPEMSGQNLVSKLFMTCSLEFSVLFRCMSAESQNTQDILPENPFSNVSLNDGKKSNQPSEITKVSCLYAVLMKIHKDVVQLDVLVSILLDLCDLENCTLLRNNILMEQCSSSSIHEEKIMKQNIQLMNVHEFGSVHIENMASGIPLHTEDYLGYLCKTRGLTGSFSKSMILSSENWISLFEKMQQIASIKVEEKAQILALSIMNLIWSQSEPNVVRDKTGLLPLLECMSQLLRKDAGLLVQMHAVCLLFSVLNRPKVLLMLNCRHSQDISAMEGVISCVLEGLAETLVLARTGPQEVKYQKQVIILLAFIASSGKSGFDVLISSGRTKGVNFLELIMQVLSSGIDTAEIADGANFEDLDIHNRRSSLMREALILLNRLASHPALSKFTLEALTCSNTVTSLTVDVVTRLCRKNKPSGRHAGACRITKFTHTDAEIVELARLFRTRVFAFLGAT